MVLIFCIQAAFMTLFGRSCSYCDVQPEIGTYILSSVVFLTFIILFVVLASKTRTPKFKIQTKDAGIHICILIICSSVLYYFYLTPGIYGLKMFKHFGYGNIGLVFKIGTTILPAFLFYLMFNSKKWVLSYLNILLIVVTLIVISYNFMTNVYTYFFTFRI